jgi:hypothetical protein
MQKPFIRRIINSVSKLEDNNSNPKDMADKRSPILMTILRPYTSPARPKMYEEMKRAVAYPPTMNAIRISEMPRSSLARIGTYVKADNMAAPAIIWIVSVFKQ